ncbi:MAG: hypothetical protein ONB46_18020 [candidate division KSB1 bacterium]|nr:hypothetical protein [candidate division KSB1 bacterium]MDZ7367806.1 hypothetical protein [candidate division KSB1 bacterium]MDZ7404866.1 hypothetical protein [candidate division KSB1 bacterium]
MNARFLVGLVLFFISNAAAGDKFGLALKAGPNFSNMRVEEKSTGRIVSSDIAAEPAFMLEFELVISKHVSYIAGFQFLRHGYSARDIDSVFTFRYFRRTTYLGMPNKLRVFFHHGRLQSFASLGVNAENLLSARYRREYDDPMIPGYELNIKALFNELTFTPELDAGLRLPLWGFYLTVEGTYAFGTENVNNPDIENLATHTRRIRDFRFAIGISRYLF